MPTGSRIFVPAVYKSRFLCSLHYKTDSCCITVSKKFIIIIIIIIILLPTRDGLSQETKWQQVFSGF